MQLRSLYLVAAMATQRLHHTITSGGDGVSNQVYSTSPVGQSSLVVSEAADPTNAEQPKGGAMSLSLSASRLQLQVMRMSAGPAPLRSTTHVGPLQSYSVVEQRGTIFVRAGVYASFEGRDVFARHGRGLLALSPGALLCICEALILSGFMMSSQTEYSCMCGRLLACYSTCRSDARVRAMRIAWTGRNGGGSHVASKQNNVARRWPDPIHPPTAVNPPPC